MSENKNELQKILDDILEDKNANLLSKNLKKDVKLLGVTGILADSSDGNVTADDITEGKIAYANNQRIIGTNNNNIGMASLLSGGKPFIVKNIKSIDLSKYNLSSIIDFTSAFENMEQLEYVTPINNGLHSMTYSNMFKNCKKLKSCPLQNRNNEGAYDTNCNSMFEGCESLEEDAICRITSCSTGWGSHSKKYFGCKSITKATFLLSGMHSGLSGGNNDFNSCFANCEKLKDVTMWGIEKSSYGDMNSLFQNCISLEKVPPFKTNCGIQYFFSNCQSLKSIENWIIGQSSYSGRYYNSVFANCISLTGENVNITFSFACPLDYWFNGCTSLIKIPDGILNSTYNHSMTNMLKGCTSLKNIPVELFARATDMGGMCSGCTGLETIGDISNSTTTSISSTFENCSNLTTIGNISMPKVTMIQGAFLSDVKLNTVGTLNLPLLQYCQNAFKNCSSLQQAPTITSTKLYYLQNMFEGCTNLQTVPIYNTSNANNMQNMFKGCNNLSNESLNNILQMCINATRITYAAYKKLSYIGLTQEQAERCQSLSNYEAFIAAGWVTGY